ncbi:MAG: 50S ribosomal protein L29 [Nanoarchaeota archaeon]
MKHKELINLSAEELDKKLDEIDLELIKLNSQVASGTTPKNPGQIRKLKKTIARIKTIQGTKTQNE